MAIESGPPETAKIIRSPAELCADRNLFITNRSWLTAVSV